jgi:hypothetical protein
MNKEQEELLDAAYENYSKEYENDNSIGMCLLFKRLDGKSTYRKPNKEMFVDLCTYDKTFSKKWGLKIEERELSLEERYELCKENTNKNPLKYSDENGNYPEHIQKPILKWMESENIPTKLITITYNNKKIESYE